MCYGGGHKKDRNSLEGNVDLRWVRLTEMPLKELLRSLWLLALLTLVLAWFQAETQSTLGSNLLKICLGSRKSIHQPQAPPQEWPRDLLACGWTGSLGGEDRVCEPTTRPATPELGHNEGYLDYRWAKHLF